MGRIGDAEYRAGARERLVDAQLLLREGQFAGSVYLAGRAVEGMLRATIWRSDSDYITGRKNLQTGHDLRRLFLLAGSSGALGSLPFRDALGDDVQRVGRLWWNDLRFLPQRRIELVWTQLGIIHKRHTFKTAATEYYSHCIRIIRRCEVLWQS